MQEDCASCRPVAASLGGEAVRVHGGHQEQVHALDDPGSPLIARMVLTQPLRQCQQHLPARLQLHLLQGLEH